MEVTELPALDENGHLQCLQSWSRAVAEMLASKDNLILTDKHWLIINLVRSIYLDTETSPPMRLLVKAIRSKVSADMANSRCLYKLFPDGPVRLACKYAGLPKPKHCL
ncbi:MAG: TusE/DsrC/DsvC family sulfur relay protein [Proteobacteria bacterium]|nr:TusE/DsrC/DsvC family sulfur relay protein [Pseudomonadota bacterium]